MLPINTAPPMPIIGVAAESVNLPITMPSLRVAWLNVPSKMTKIEFDTLVNSLKMFEAALVVQPEPPRAEGNKALPKEAESE